jgi:hypothetical protein
MRNRAGQSRAASVGGLSRHRAGTLVALLDAITGAIPQSKETAPARGRAEAVGALLVNMPGTGRHDFRTCEPKNRSPDSGPPFSEN